MVRASLALCVGLPVVHSVLKWVSRLIKSLNILEVDALVLITLCLEVGESCVGEDFLDSLRCGRCSHILLISGCHVHLIGDGLLKHEGLAMA